MPRAWFLCTACGGVTEVEVGEDSARPVCVCGSPTISSVDLFKMGGQFVGNPATEAQKEQVVKALSTLVTGMNDAMEKEGVE